MENKAKVIDVPNIIRMEVSGNDRDETIFIDQSHAITSIHTYLSDWEGRETKHYRAIKASLIRDLREARSCNFNPVPKNLPGEIFNYMLTQNQVHGEGFLATLIQLIIYSEDRGMSHWYMDSEEGQLFLGDINFPIPNLKEV